MKDNFHFEILSSHISGITYKALNTTARKRINDKYDLQISDSIHVSPDQEHLMNIIVERHVFLSPKGLFDIRVKGVVAIELTDNKKSDNCDQSRVEYVEKNKKEILQEAELLDLISLTVSQIIMVSKNPLFITPPICIGKNES
jgi:hypothetical protein